VIVVADFDSFTLAGLGVDELEHCTWLLRERQGVVAAVVEACAAARGTHWFLFNDESILDAGALELLYHASLREPACLFGPLHLPRYTFQYFGHEFIPFPFAHRDVFAKLGGVLDPAFKSFYADPDLGLRAHAAGVPMRTVEEAVLRHHNGQDDAKVQNMAQYMRSDQVTFRAKWAHLGAFSDC
jgi:GT2 family glycosyltransferase